MPWTLPLLRTVPALWLFYKKIPAQRLTNTYFPAIILLVRYGWLAQLVRALRSHRRGRGFESPILHHTVRTRTRFLKKGSGMFLFIGGFAFATATNTPVGCLSNRTVCVSRWRSFAPTSSAEGLLGTVNRNEQRQGIIVAMASCLLCYMAHSGAIAAYAGKRASSDI